MRKLSLMLIFFSFLLVNCSTIQKFNLMKDKNSSPAIITGDHIVKNLFDVNSFRIIAVDDKKLNYKMNGDLYSSKILLSEGKHKFLVKYEGSLNETVKFYEISAYLYKGQSYKITGTLLDNGYDVKSWIENVKLRKKITEDIIFKPNKDIKLYLYL